MKTTVNTSTNESTNESANTSHPLTVTRRRFCRRTGAVIGAASVLPSALLQSPAANAFPPDSYFKGVARMGFHENPWGPSDAAIEAINEVLSRNNSGQWGSNIHRYGDFLQHDLKQAILTYNGLDQLLDVDNVVLGIGSTEVLFMAADAYLAKDALFMTEWPTYFVIIDRANQHQAQVDRVPLLPNWKADLDTMLDKAKNAHLSGNPYQLIHFNVINNPMGTYLEKDSFDKFARAMYEVSPNTLIICDDSDHEFMESDSQANLFRAAQHVAEGENMLHVQTFSHCFGLTGLRIGYGIASKKIIRKLNAHKIFAGLNVLGEAAALASLESPAAQIARVNRLCTESRDWLYGELEAMGLEYHRSQGHYIMINLQTLNGTIAILKLFLWKKVFVRWGMDWDMNNWIRVNPGTEYENQRFIAALKWLLGTDTIAANALLPGQTVNAYFQSSIGNELRLSALQAGFPAKMLHRAGLLV